METEKLTRVFSRTPSSWDPQDDLLLRHLKEQQKLGWKEIASHFAHRTPNACQFRWRRLRSGSLKGQSSASSSQSTPTASSMTKETSTSPSTSPSSASPPQTSAQLMSKFQSKPDSNTNSIPVAVPALSYTFGKEKKTMDDDSADPLSSSLNSNSSSSSAEGWTAEEDALLLARRKRALSFAELSILLPQRTEVEITRRISLLEPIRDPLKEETKQIYLSSTPRRQRHSHSVHTPTHTGGVLRERSFSSSSQNSVGSFLTGDSLRSQSFSYNVPPLFNSMPLGERYTLRKGSISNVRRNSVLRESAVSDDEDEKPKLPSLGVLFHDYFTK